MIVSRYMLKEIITTMLMIVMVLLFIVMSNQFILYLNSAASGGITLVTIFKLMLLQVPLYLSYLFPLALFVAVLIVFGQLYVNQEMSILFACGYGQLQLTKLVMLVAIPVALIVGLVNFEVQPLIQKYQFEMRHNAMNSFSVDKLFPKRFQDILGMGWVLYAGKELNDGLGDVFLVRHYPEAKDYPHGYWEVVRTSQLHQSVEKNPGNEFVYLENGVSYRGQPGEKNYRIVHFSQSALELSNPEPTRFSDRNKVENLAFQALSHAYDGSKAAQVEFNWRLSVSCCALILALWVVPLSYLKPRQGRYAKVFYASLLCLFYLNMMFVSRNFAFSSEISPMITIWWIHVLMLLLLAIFLSCRHGEVPSFFKFRRPKIL